MSGRLALPRFAPGGPHPSPVPTGAEPQLAPAAPEGRDVHQTSAARAETQVAHPATALAVPLKADPDASGLEPIRRCGVPAATDGAEHAAEPVAGWASRPLRERPVFARYAPREGRVHASKQWALQQAERVRLVNETLRRAVAVTRGWPCDGTKYLDGPCEGLTVREVQDVALRIAFCGTDSAIRPTAGGPQGDASTSPARCGFKNLCPVCAAADSAKRAARIRVVAGRAGRPGALLHVVLTHRDRPPGAETLHEGVQRFVAAWERMGDGKKGAWWRTAIYGGVACFELTRGKTGRTWHPHFHMILELPEGVDVAAFRDALALRWARCTALAGEPVGAAGWDRAAWTDPTEPERGERGCELVAQAVPLSETVTDETMAIIRSAVAQIAKYPSPLAELSDPAAMAEFLTWSHGQHMTRWLGGWKRGDVQEWIDEQVKLDREDARETAAKAGRAPNVGRMIPGVKPTGLDALNEAVAREGSKRK